MQADAALSRGHGGAGRGVGAPVACFEMLLDHGDDPEFDGLVQQFGSVEAFHGSGKIIGGDGGGEGHSELWVLCDASGSSIEEEAIPPSRSHTCARTPL